MLYWGDIIFAVWWRMVVTHRVIHPHTRGVFFRMAVAITRLYLLGLFIGIIHVNAGSGRPGVQTHE